MRIETGPVAHAYVPKTIPANPISAVAIKVAVIAPRNMSETKKPRNAFFDWDSTGIFSLIANSDSCVAELEKGSSRVSSLMVGFALGFVAGFLKMDGLLGAP